MISVRRIVQGPVLADDAKGRFLRGELDTLYARYPIVPINPVEAVAVRPAPNTRLAPDQLDDARSDARLVGVVPETGTVVLDVANADLEYLREKLDAFANDARVETKTRRDGTTTNAAPPTLAAHDRRGVGIGAGELARGQEGRRGEPDSRGHLDGFSFALRSHWSMKSRQAFRCSASLLSRTREIASFEARSCRSCSATGSSSEMKGRQIIDVSSIQVVPCSFATSVPR
jgi:hypothetical protein